MPALPNVNKVLQCSLNHLFEGGLPAATRFFIRYTGSAPSQVELQAFTDTLIASWSANCIAAVSTFCAISTAESVDLTTSTSPQATFTDFVAGTRAGDRLPDEVAAVASYALNRRYRGGHPRGYWPFGVDADLQDVAHWDDGALTDFQGAVDGFFTDTEAAGWSGAGTLSHVNVSYYSGFTVVVDPVTGRARNRPTPRVTPLVSDITANLVRARLGTQRRRLGR